MKFSRTVLPNGLRIITVPMSGNATITVMVLVEAGSKYETKEINGISHFLEHLCFKGTTKRTVFQITEELDGLGAESNAFTSEEYTGYYAKAHHKHTDRLIDVVSDIYLNATLPPAEINKERGVIIEEINMYEDMPQRTVWDTFEHLLYGNQPGGMTVLGPKENILKLTQEDFMKYREKHYVASGTTVVVAGHMDERKVRSKIEEAFTSITSTKKHEKKVTRELQKKPAITFRYKKTDQAHLVLGCRAFDKYDERIPAAQILATVLGQGMSSRLFKIMRDERGMCYYVKAAMNHYTDVGYFAVATGTNKKRLQEAVEIILSELYRISRESITSRELIKAKEYIIGTTALGVESSSDYAEWVGFQEVYHKPIETVSDYYEKLRKVTTDDVKKVAEYLFTNDRLNLAVVGPYRDMPALRKKFKW